MNQNVSFDEEPEVDSVRATTDSESKMVQWLLKKKIVKTDNQAVILLLTIIIVALLITIILLVIHYTEKPSVKFVLPDNMQQQINQNN